MCVPDGLWLEEEEGTDGARGLLGARIPALCLHWYRQQRAGNAATQLRGEGKDQLSHSFRTMVVTLGYG